ncbi:hypothetical protein LUZ60_010464 [Juncus effusus]|nr:hypothetical protein LUZ60_010464 [Juncus effusus]
MEDENFDILTWWKCNAPKYPVLGRMARDILSIHVSTVASEAAFSTGGRILNEYRSRLKPEVVEALACTQDWLRDQINKDSSNDSFAEATSTLFSALQFDSEIDGCSIALS